MRRRPRDPNAPLFSGAFVAWSLLQGAFVLATVVALFVSLLSSGTSESDSRAAAFTALVIANVGLTVVNRSFGGSWISGFLRPNRVFWAMVAMISTLLAIALLVPSARELFRFGSLGGDTLALGIGVGIGTMVALESFKVLGLSLSAVAKRLSAKSGARETRSKSVT